MCEDLTKKLLNEIEGWEIDLGFVFGRKARAEGWKFCYGKELIKKVAEMLEPNLDVLFKEKYRNRERKVGE
jgi:hypothetical protein